MSTNANGTATTYPLLLWVEGLHASWKMSAWCPCSASEAPFLPVGLGFALPMAVGGELSGLAAAAAAGAAAGAPAAAAAAPLDAAAGFEAGALLLLASAAALPPAGAAAGLAWGRCAARAGSCFATAQRTELSVLAASIWFSLWGALRRDRNKASDWL